jgi:uncharacterized protein YecE (DUF72 family)
MKAEANVLIGCAGWSVSSRVASDMAIPLTGSHLQRYAAVLSAVEINSSFYRPHRPQTYVRWRESTPTSFRFSVKVPRQISHERRLVDVDEMLERFIDETANLEEKLGCLLLQLPPTLKFDMRVAAGFLDRITSKTRTKLMCEPRHPSWFGLNVNELLEEYQVTRVAADPAIGDTGSATVPRSDTTYFRLHGTPDMYKSPYSEKYLSDLAGRIRQLTHEGQKVWCVFDNTANGAALGNALFLQCRISSTE